MFLSGDSKKLDFIDMQSAQKSGFMPQKSITSQTVPEQNCLGGAKSSPRDRVANHPTLTRTDLVLAFEGVMP